MTIYQHLVNTAEEQEPGFGYGDKLDYPIPVTSLCFGIGYVNVLENRNDPFPILVRFESGATETYTLDGRGWKKEVWPQIAFGHFEKQSEVVAAIEKQDFEMIQI